MADSRLVVPSHFQDANATAPAGRAWPIVPAFLSGAKAPSPAPAFDYAEMRAHIELLHPTGGDGTFFLASKLIGKGGYSETSYDCDRVMTQRELANMQFVSMNRFQRRATRRLLQRVGHVWLEFDPYAEDARGHPLPYRDMPIEDLRTILAAAIETAGLPAPSYWTASGRGLHAVWICEALPANAAKKIRRIMDAFYGPSLAEDGSVPARKHADPDRDAQEARLAPMWRLFRDAGLDRGTQDSARVLRIWGSYNPASHSICRRLWPVDINDVQRCRIDTIADAVLPLTNLAYWQRMQERAAMPPLPEKPARVRRGSPYAGKAGVWDRKLADLLRLREHRGRIGKGQRHAWTFLTANAYAQSKGGDPGTWAALLAPLAGLTLKDALDCLGSLGRRQKRNLAGEISSHGGVEWNPLFHHSGAKLADLLGVTLDEADAAGLTLVRPGKAIAVPSIDRKRAKRVRDGAVPQADRADAKLHAGREGLALRAAGKTHAEAIAAIQSSTGKGRTWAIEAMKIAAAARVEIVPEDAVVAPVQRKSDLREVRFSGRYIGASGPLPASASVATPAASIGSVSEPYARPFVTRISSISTRIDTAPDVGYIVVDDPRDRLIGRYVVTIQGDHTELPAGLEGLIPQRRRPSPRTARNTSRRRPVATACQPPRPGLTAEEYRRLTKGY